MFYRELGTSGIKVSAICAGCMSFGKPSEDFHLWTLDEKNTSDRHRSVNFSNFLSHHNATFF